MPGYTRDVLPPFAGPHTFARSPRGLVGDLRAGSVAIVGVPFGGPSRGRPGEGPDAIRRASVDFVFDLESSPGRSVVNTLTERMLTLPGDGSIVDLGDVDVETGDPERIAGLAHAAVAAIASRGAFPLVLSGVSSLTAGLADAYCEGARTMAGIIRLSSRLDLPLEIEPDDGRRVVFIGTDGQVPYARWREAERAGATVITGADARGGGVRAAARQAVQIAGKGCDAIFVSLDMSVVDSGHSAGTPGFTIGGLTPAELLDLMTELSGIDAICALEVSGVAPSLDDRYRTERLAAEAIVELIAPRAFAGGQAAISGPGGLPQKSRGRGRTADVPLSPAPFPRKREKGEAVADAGSGPAGATPRPGFGTLFESPQGTVEELRPGTVAFLGVPFDLSCSDRAGARLGPAACRAASAYYAVFGGAFEEITTGRLLRVPAAVDLGDVAVHPHDWDATEVILRRTVAAVVGAGGRPVTIGGDHFVTSALVAGFREGLRSSTGRAGYVQFSSQLDLGTEDRVWGSVWRGATARRIIESHAVEPGNMVWVGTNGYVRSDQLAFAREHDLAVFTLDDVRAQGIAAVTRRAIEIAGRGCDSAYVSIDLDVLDGGYMPTTSRPSFRGLTDVELLTAADVLGEGGVGALDVTGLNPTVESAAITGARFAAWLILRFISEQSPIATAGGRP